MSKVLISLLGNCSCKEDLEKLESRISHKLQGIVLDIYFVCEKWKDGEETPDNVIRINQVKEIGKITYFEISNFLNCSFTKFDFLLLLHNVLTRPVIKALLKIHFKIFRENSGIRVFSIDDNIIDFIF